MPKFIQLADGERKWYEWDETHMALDTIEGFTAWKIDENDPVWMNAKCLVAEDWHDLYIKTQYCPKATSLRHHYLWLDPYGCTYEGQAHALEAEYICESVYGKGSGVVGAAMELCDDFLIEHGWVKLSASMMLPHYIECGMYDHLTGLQKETIKDWCDLFGLNWQELFYE